LVYLTGVPAAYPFVFQYPHYSSGANVEAIAGVV